MTEDRRIYLIKGLAICGVLFCHTESSHLHPAAIARLSMIASVSQWSVPLFLFCAGMLHGRSAAKQPKTFQDYALMRARRLLAPWLLVQLANKLLWFVVIFSGIFAVNNLSYLLRSRWSFFGGQFYFLPLLLCISVSMQAILCWRRPAAIWVTCMLALAFILAFFPTGPFLGWHLGAYWWGMFMYSAGILTQERLAALRMPSWRPLELAGEASGTIFLYHLPFVLSSLLIIDARLIRDPIWQFIGAVTAIGLTVAILSWIHFRLKGTRFSWLLL